MSRKLFANARNIRHSSVLQMRYLSTGEGLAHSTSVEMENRPNLPGLSEMQLRRIEYRDFEYRMRQHVDPPGVTDPAERDEARRKRMIYRSKQRGWLEADILMGSFAVKYVPTLSDRDLDDYEVILSVETIDIFNYVSGKDTPPDHLKDLPVMRKMQDYAQRVNVSGPEDYRTVKTNSNLT